MHVTTFDEFRELAQRGTFVPVYKEIVADLLTPVSAFLKIAEHSDYAFLLESVEGGEQVGRYSFLGKDPFLILRSRGGKTIVDRTGQTSESGKPFVAAARELMAGFHSPFVPGLPRFTGGAVGYLSKGGDLDFAIAIRTAVCENDVFTVTAGAGIVEGSVPDAEAEETRSKAQSLLSAIASVPGDREY